MIYTSDWKPNRKLLLTIEGMMDADEEMLGTEVLHLQDLPRVHRHDDLAEEYSIRLDNDALSGLIVYGRFRGRWVANPNLRPVVAELIRRLDLIPDKCDVEGCENQATCWSQPVLDDDPRPSTARCTDHMD